MPNQAKFTHWRSPGLSEIQLHYGHANDPKDYEYMTHGMRSDDKSFVSNKFHLDAFLSCLLSYLMHFLK